MKLGIIGAQSKHVTYFTQQFHGPAPVGKHSVYALSGPDVDNCNELVYSLGIAKTYFVPAKVIEQCDAVLVLLRRGEEHTLYALSCLQAKKPVFVDKPFALSAKDAKAMIDASKFYSTPLMGGSTLCFLPKVQELRPKAKKAKLAVLSYRADTASPFGGWNFYGSHLTDLCAHLFGRNASSLQAHTDGAAVWVQVDYPQQKVVLYSHPRIQTPQVTLFDEQVSTYTLDDTLCYRYGMQAFCRMLENGKSQYLDELYFSSLLLESIQQALTNQSKLVINGPKTERME